MVSLKTLKKTRAMLRTIVIITSLCLFVLSCELVDLMGDQHISQNQLGTLLNMEHM